MKVLLHEMSWVEAKEYFQKNDTAIIPVGSNEQHGPHNPLGTDHLIARAIAEEAAKRTGIICLPTIPFGVSPHHKQFWGTIHVSPEVFARYVEEVCLALAYYGVRKIVIVNGHGGNLAPLVDLALRDLRAHGVFVSVFQWWTATGKLLPDLFIPEERRHASSEETSMNMALHPHLVDMSRAEDGRTQKSELQREGITLPLGTVDETSSGVFGKALSASAEKGKKDFEVVVEELVDHIKILRKAPIEDLVEKPKV